MIRCLSAYVSRNRWGGVCIVRSMKSRFAVQSSRAAARDALRVMLDSYPSKMLDTIISDHSLCFQVKHFNLKRLGEFWILMVQTTPTFTQTSDTVLKLVAVGFLSVVFFCTICNPTERKPKRRFSMYPPQNRRRCACNRGRQPHEFASPLPTRVLVAEMPAVPIMEDLVTNERFACHQYLFFEPRSAISRVCSSER